MSSTKVELIVDKFISVNIEIPQRMGIIEFVGILMRVKKLIPNDAITDGILPTPVGRPRTIHTTESVLPSTYEKRSVPRWKPEWKEILKKHQGKSSSERITQLINDPYITVKKVRAMTMYMRSAGQFS